MNTSNKSETRNLILYILVAYGFTWTFWILRGLAERGQLDSSSLVDFLVSPFNPAAWGPLVGALVMTWVNERGEGVIRLLKRGIDFRFPAKWWIPILLILPMTTGIPLLIAYFAGERIPELPWISNPFSIVTQFFVFLVMQGPLAEEFGWRGYALGRLQMRFNALTSSILIGTIWACWHLPYVYWLAPEHYYASGFIPLLISDIVYSVLITWFYNNTNGSILPGLIIHTMFIHSLWMFPAERTQLGAFLWIVITVATVIAVVAYWGPRKLVRETSK